MLSFVDVAVVGITSRDRGSLSNGIQSNTFNTTALEKEGEQEKQNVRQMGSNKDVTDDISNICFPVVKMGDFLRAWRKLYC